MIRKFLEQHLKKAGYYDTHRYTTKELFQIWLHT